MKANKKIFEVTAEHSDYIAQTLHRLKLKPTFENINVLLDFAEAAIQRRLMELKDTQGWS